MNVSSSSIAVRVGAVLLVASVWAGVARAGLDYRPTDGRWIRVEYQHTAFSGGDFGVEDANWVLDARASLDNGMGLRMEVPITHLSQDYRDILYGQTVTSSATALGNLYFGLETPRGDSGDAWEFGIWLPTAPENGEASLASALASAGDWVGGLERFFPNTFGAVGMAHIIKRYMQDNLGLHVDLGMSAANYASEDWKGSLLWGAGLDLISQAGPALGVGVQARSLLAENTDVANVDLVIQASFDGEMFEPTVQFRRPLDSDRSEIVDAVLRVGLRAELP